MKYPIEWQDEFKSQHGSVVNNEDFMAFLEAKGVGSILDPDALRRQAMARLAKDFRNTFKASDGTCLWGDFTQDGQKMLGLITAIDLAAPLESMLKHETKRLKGSIKKIRLLRRQIRAAQNQMRLPLDEVAVTTERQASSWA